MKNIKTEKRFDKQFAKFSVKVKSKCIERFEIFTKDKFAEVLNNHKLNTPFLGCRSINISGDYRAVYYERKDGVCVFVAIGTHSQLYK